MANTAADIQKLYIAYFNRPADPNGLAYWMAQSFTLGQIADSFSKQAEYATVYAGKTTEDTVNTIYNNLFGHKADVAGLNYWTGQLLNGKVTLGQAALAILGGATGADKVAVDSKVAAATSFTTAIDTNEEIVAYSLPANTALAKDWLSKVLDSATQASQIAVQDAVLTSIVNGGGVKDFTLTSNTDIATAENFTAGLVYTPNGGSRVNALQDEDVLTGSNTSATANNKLTATLGNSNDNGAAIVTPTLKNIQTATFTFTGSADGNNVNNNAVVAVDLQDGTGLKTVGINRIASTAGTNTARIENIKQAVETMNLTSTNANNTGVVEFSFGNGTLLGANTGTLNLSDVQVGTVNIGQNVSGTSAAGVANQGYETLTINSTGNTNNIGTLNLPMDTGTAGKVIITGDKDLTLAQTSNVVNGVTTIESTNFSGGILQAAGRLSAIDASAFKGNLTLNLGNGIFTTGKADTSGSVQNVTITGGSGNDTFYLADTVETGDSITGGDGTDTLVIVNGGNVTAGAAGSSIITKVEAVQVLLNNAASTVDFAKLPDVTGVLVRNVSNTNVAAPANSAPVAGTDVFTLNNLSVGQAAAITIRHSDTGSNAIGQSTINANLATATGASDTVAVTIAEGLNVDPRFNFVLNTNAVENITLVDADTESNTVALANVAAHTGTITIGTTAGAGSTTTFLNLDTTVAGNGGLYRIDTTGGAAANIAGVQELSKTAGQIKLIAANIDASAETASVIVRVSTSGAANGAQNIKMGAGNDTVTFDNIQDTRAGLTISDTVVGGAGTDTLVIDGDLTGAALGDTIALGASEWTNVSGFETIRLVGTSNNAGVDGAGNYRLTLTDALIAANNNAGVLAIVNDNDTANDAANAADTAGTAVESAVVIDARTLSATSRFSYNGEEGASRTADRIIFTDANFNGSHAINGGAVDNNSTNNSQKNDDVIELRNATNAAIGDFNGISNVGNIELTNDTAVTQVSQIQLNDTIVDALVDSYQAANTTTHVERLTIRAIDNVNVANATVGVSIDAGALTAQSALDVTLARGANFLQLGAGADRVVLLGNYVAGTYLGTENGVSLNAQSTANAVARVVTDTINLGAGNDTLVTYGAINLAGAQLSGIENITANSAVVITASQYAALIAARAALNLSGPVLTFSGVGPHQLTIVDDVAGANNIDLSYISITGGTLVYDVTSSSNATGGNVNNTTTSNAIIVSGGASATAGVIGTNPVNGGGTALTPIALTAGGVFNSTANVNDNFTGNAAALVGTTVNGNAGDTDIITFTGGGSIVIGGGNTITNIKTLATDNTSTDVYFNVATAGVTTVNGGTGNDRVYLANSGSSMLAGNVNLGAGNNTLTMEGKTYSGTFTAGAGTSDILSLVASSNIAGANISGFESLVVASNAGITLSAAQYSAFTSITATGTNAFTFSTAGTIAGNATVENYVLANGTNTFTGAAGLISVTGGTGVDTFTVGDAIITATVAANGINGGVGAGDILNVGAVTAALDMSAKVTDVETVNVTGGTNAAWTVTNENGAGVTLNFTKSASTAINNVILGTGGQTLNILGTGTGATTITGGSGADTINLSTTATGADTIATGSVISAIDTVANFKIAGADVFKTGTAATTLNALNIATADTATLAAAIATAATAAGASLAANTQAYIITVAAGTAAGTYAFQNIGGTVGAVDATDFIVKLVGAGSIVAGDFIA
ncbi:hypothetical protein UNDYM_4785 [Undibacterium sp. YM2]|uniref:beta strand repeat-containing protein n=1 Tax=Undibacterium sp. YM2 TaxID=2058625 RepID=UPI001331DA4C|nr:DUF4214 domain-containing protein [Undibacterium sp. YM2]BBB69038.1 hypothetical protein UNDYM_4785 [Undibacterium sp. YM2]